MEDRNALEFETSVAGHSVRHTKLLSEARHDVQTGEVGERSLCGAKRFVIHSTTMRDNGLMMADTQWLEDSSDIAVPDALLLLSKFVERFMDINVSIGLNDALDLCWQTLAECFEPEELLMKQNLVDKYFPPAKKRAEAAVQR